MMEVCELDHVLRIEPKYFDHGIHDHIVRCVHRDLHQKCIAGSGYILDVSDDVTILRNYLPTSGGGDALVTVRCSATVLNPRVGSDHTAVVQLATADGIVVLIGGLVSVVVRAESITAHGDRYTFSGQTFSHPRCRSISVGDSVRITITEMIYSNQSLRGIALVHNDEPPVTPVKLTNSAKRRTERTDRVEPATVKRARTLVAQ